MRAIKSLLLLVIASSILWADGGSLYTRKGIGDLYFAMNARRFAMGGGGLALNNITDISSLNPAGWNAIRKTRFDIGAYYNGMKLENNSSSMNYSHSNMTGFSFAVPIDTLSGMVLTSGLVPYSKVSYEVITTATDPLVGKFTTNFEGNGGLNTIYFGLSANLPLDFKLGAAFEYYFGKIEYNAKITIDNTIYKGGIFKNQNNFKGTGVNLGLISPDISKVFGSKDISDFRIAATLNLNFSMTRDSSEISGNTDSTFVSSSVMQDVNMPSRLGIGAAVKLFNRYQIVADYFTQSFSDLSINNRKLPIYKNLNRYSVGFEYTHPSPDRDSFWDKVALRLGFNYEETQYLINSMSLTQYGITAGFSIPLGGQNAVDIAFQMGKRGTTDNNLIKESFYTINIGFSLGELWFIPLDR